MSTVASELAAIRKRLKGVRLTAVSKGQTTAVIREALVAGQRVFGENRVQEAQKKFSPLRALYPDLELHLIGPLQTNKVEAALDLFDVIETLDRKGLADALKKAIPKRKKAPQLFIQVNIGHEPQKSGIEVEEVEEFFSYCRDQCHLSISGLMCLPPQGQNPEPYFHHMKRLADKLSLPHLSMGMSEDFELAVTCGATDVRLGRALFGKRP